MLLKRWVAYKRFGRCSYESTGQILLFVLFLANFLVSHCRSLCGSSAVNNNSSRISNLSCAINNNFLYNSFFNYNCGVSSFCSLVTATANHGNAEKNSK